VSASRHQPAFSIELSDEEILDDLCWPNPPPARWPLGLSRYRSNGRPTVRASRNDGSSPAKRASGSGPESVEHRAEEAGRPQRGSDVEDVAVAQAQRA
jgi:hypothetical protein